MTEYFHALKNVYTLSIDGHKNLRLLLVRWRIWAGLDHVIITLQRGSPAPEM